MNRRVFTSAVVGLIATARGAQPAPTRRYTVRPSLPEDRPVVWLEGVVARRLPERVALVETRTGHLEGPAINPRSLPALFELRTYLDADAALSSLLTALGIEPWLASSREMLIPFESFSHREQVWREVTARRTWPAYRFAIYRPVTVLRTT